MPTTPTIPAHYTRIAGSERLAAAAAVRQGAADPSEAVQVTICLRRRVDGPPAPDFDAVAAVPLNSRAPMSEADFAAKYGAHPEDIAKVVDFVETAGLKVVETNAARRTVVAAGSVANMNRAFAVDLGRYTAAAPARARNVAPVTETYRGREGFVHVPSSVGDIVLGVFGLDNRTVLKRNAADPANTHTLSIPTLKSLYNFPTNSAAGQTIGIVSLSGYAVHDVQLLFNGLGAGYTMPTVHDVNVHLANSGTTRTARPRRTSASPRPPPTARRSRSTSPWARRPAGSTSCTASRTRARATRTARCSRAAGTSPTATTRARWPQKASPPPSSMR